MRCSICITYTKGLHFSAFHILEVANIILSSGVYTEFIQFVFHGARASPPAQAIFYGEIPVDTVISSYSSAKGSGGQRDTHFRLLPRSPV